MQITKITTIDNKSRRIVKTVAPRCLRATDLNELIGHVGQNTVYVLAMSQLMIKFRAHVRAKLSQQISRKGNLKKDYSEENLKWSLKKVKEMDFLEWKPKTKQRKSKEEKAKEQLKVLKDSGYTKEQIMQFLAD